MRIDQALRVEIGLFPDLDAPLETVIPAVVAAAAYLTYDLPLADLIPDLEAGTGRLESAGPSSLMSDGHHVLAPDHSSEGDRPVGRGKDGGARSGR